MTAQTTLLQRLFVECEGELTRFLKKRLGSWAAAADVTHDMFVKLHRAETFSVVRNRRAYLFRMAANLAADQLRVESRRREILDEAPDAVAGHVDPITPERQAMARAELAEMRAEIARLPPRCRRVFYLQRFEGRSHGQIAHILGISVTTVQKDLKKAINALVAARRRFNACDGRNDADSVA